MSRNSPLVGCALGLLVHSLAPRVACAEMGGQIGVGGGMAAHHEELGPSLAGGVRVRLARHVGLEFELAGLSYGAGGRTETAYEQSPSLVLINPVGQLEIAVGIGATWHEVEIRDAKPRHVGHTSRMTDSVFGEIGWSARRRWAPYVGWRRDFANHGDGDFYPETRCYAGVRFNPFQ